MHRINAFNLKTQEIHHYLLEMRNDGKYLCCLYTLGKQVLFVSVVVFYATQIYRILPTLKSQVTVDLIMFPRVPNADQVRMDDYIYGPKKIVEEGKCPICHEIMKEATNTCSSGHQLRSTKYISIFLDFS